MGKFIVVLQDMDAMVYKQSIEAEAATEAVVTAIQKACAETDDDVCEDFTQYEVLAVYPEFSDLTETLDEDVFSILETDDF